MFVLSSGMLCLHLRMEWFGTFVENNRKELCMRYINEFREGDTVSDVYLCKSKNISKTKAGKTYYSLILQDKTGVIDTKIWNSTMESILLSRWTMSASREQSPASRAACSSMSAASAGSKKANICRRITFRVPPGM